MYIRYPLSQYRVHWCYTPLTPLISALTSALDPQLFSLSNHYGPVQVSVYLYISIHFQWFVHYIARHNYWYFSTNSGLVCICRMYINWLSEKILSLYIPCHYEYHSGFCLLLPYIARHIYGYLTADSKPVCIFSRACHSVCNTFHRCQFPTKIVMCVKCY